MPEAEEAAAWQSVAQELLTHTHQHELLAEQRPLYEEFLSKFPTAVSNAASCIVMHVPTVCHVDCNVHSYVKSNCLTNYNASRQVHEHKANSMLL